MTSNDWNAWRHHVLGNLSDLKVGHKEIDQKLDLIHSEISALKVKAGLWGLIGGIIPAAGFILVELLLSLKRP